MRSTGSTWRPLPVYEVRWHAGVAELQDLGLGVAPRLALCLAPAGPDVTINPVHTLTIPLCATQLLSGNVSHVLRTKTRVCEPHSQGDSSTDSSTRTAPELARIWSEDRPAQVSPLGLAGSIQQPYNRSQRSSAHTVRFSAFAYRADLWATGNRGPAPDGVQFRSLTGEFAT